LVQFNYLPEFNLKKEFNIGYPHAGAVQVVKPGSRSIKNKLIAWELDKAYYDGERENGYGGFRYDGRWATIMPVACPHPPKTGGMYTISFDRIAHWDIDLQNQRLLNT
jgi:hypothetical protein